MTEKELDRHAEQEVSSLQYYATKESRGVDKFDDAQFYDRLKSIGYVKVSTPLYIRCPACRITSDKPVLESSLDELRITTEYWRDHSENVFTPLEYVLYKKIGIYQEFINILKQ